jgi:RNA polymerase sigma-70 factor (ECF subfamily)
VAREKLSQVRHAQHVRGWLCAVLRNCYLKGFRQHVPTPAANLELNLDNVAEEADESPIDSEQLQAALGRLPADFRLVLLMFYFEESSYREIADALAIPLGTVMSRLARAKNYLRRLLQSPASEKSPLSEKPLTTEKPLIAEKVGQPVQPAASLPQTRPETETSLLPFPSGPIATRR